MDLSTSIDIHEKKHFGITLEEILKFENDPENIKGYGGVLGIAKLLKVDPVIGINDTPEETEVRTKSFGSNTYPVTKPKSYWFFLLEAFKDETLGILIGCAIASLIVGLLTEDPKEGWYDGGGVCFAVVLVVLVSSISNYRQTLQFLQLNDEKRKILINVCRSGRRAKIVIFDLVVGDVVHLSIGDQIPGDGILIEGHSLVIDESSMTGESDPMKKDEEHPFLLSGCKVIDGSGSFLITAVGMHTEWGKVMATLSEENDEETPLQVRLNSLAQMVGNVGISVAVCVFLVLIIRFLASEVNFKHFTSKDGHRILEFFSIAVTIVVVAVPEGLPLAVTLTLAYSMKKMMIDKALVRHLSACETMGCATTICSDKTGTLTMNQMTVVKSWVLGQLWDPESNGTFPNFTVVERVFQSACMNTTGFVHVVEGKSPEVSGSPTEVAVLNWAIKLGADYMGIKKEYKVLCVDTFNSTKKRMGIVIQGDDGNVWAHWKGASEIVLKECSHYIDTDGIVKILTPEKQVELEEIISSFAKGALRTLCLAFRQLEHDEIVAINPKRTQNDIPDQGLVCLAIVGIKDPCRPGVPEAVRRCQIAGIKVRMVTGDNIITAKAIATECGILTDGTAIEGKDFRNMSEEEQKKIIPSIQVMARSSPTDKHKLVQRLLEMGDIVAVTGDGTNDAPALHEASIGLSMGIAGTEVAKESSDIIILDDNFASIVKVVRWGRSVYANIQKFIQFQCTVNGVALGINFITAISAGEAPLTAVQLLWVNLIMDTMGALALATEPPDERLMLKKPVAKKDPLITNIMWRNMFGQGDEEHAKKELLTIIFNSFVFCQICNEINARKPEEFNVFSGIFSNYIFSIVLILTCGVQIILVQFLGNFTSTVQLSWQYWLICIAFGIPSFPIAILFKFIPVPEKPFFSQLTSPKKLIFREGGTIKGMLIRRNSKKNVDLKRLKSVRSQKFYVDLEQEVEAHNVESSSNQGNCCLQSCLCCCMPSHPTPSPSNGTEKPSKRNAWK